VKASIRVVELTDTFVANRGFSAEVIEKLKELLPGQALHVVPPTKSRSLIGNLHTLASRNGMRIKTRKNGDGYYVWRA